MNNDFNNKEVFQFLKRRHLIDAVKEYSDYVTDLRGKSFEEFVREDYLQDKTLENVIVPTEQSERTIYDIVQEQLSNHIEIGQGRDINSSQGYYHQDDFDQALNDMVDVIQEYIKDNC